MRAHERRHAVAIEDVDECNEPHSDALMALPAQRPTRAQRADWAVGLRWIVGLSVLGWLIVLTAVRLAWPS